MEKRARVLIDCEDAKGLVYKISALRYSMRDEKCSEMYFWRPPKG